YIAPCTDTLLSPAYRHNRSVRLNGIDRWDRTEPSGGRGIVGRDVDGALGAVPLHELRRRARGGAPAVSDDRDPIAETLRLLHQMGREKHGLTALADTA